MVKRYIVVSVCCSRCSCCRQCSSLCLEQRLLLNALVVHVDFVVDVHGVVRAADHVHVVGLPPTCMAAAVRPALTLSHGSDGVRLSGVVVAAGGLLAPYCRLLRLIQSPTVAR